MHAPHEQPSEICTCLRSATASTRCPIYCAGISERKANAMNRLYSIASARSSERWVVGTFLTPEEALREYNIETRSIGAHGGPTQPSLEYITDPHGAEVEYYLVEEEVTHTAT